MKFKTIIVEDEPLAQKKLEKMLNDFPDQVEIIGIAENGPEAVAKINELKPDLIFLDIQIPGFDGFSVLKKIADIPLVIFTTAYNEFALKAFETNSIDYLLKPFTNQRLAQSLSKISTLNEKMQASKKVEKIMNSEVIEDILIKIGEKIFFISTNEIQYFSAEEKYTYAFTKKDDFLTDYSLKDLEDKLGENFFRVHRSFIINKNFIKEVKKKSYRKYIAIMKNGEKIQVSRSKIKSFLEFFKKYI